MCSKRSRPITLFPKDAILLNKTCSFSKFEPITKRNVAKKLNELAKKANLTEHFTGYSIHKGTCNWAYAQGCSPDDLQIMG